METPEQDKFAARTHHAIEEEMHRVLSEIHEGLDGASIGVERALSAIHGGLQSTSFGFEQAQSGIRKMGAGLSRLADMVRGIADDNLILDTKIQHLEGIVLDLVRRLDKDT